MMDSTVIRNLAVKKSIPAERVIYKGAFIILGLSIAYLLSVFITGTAWLPLSEIEVAPSELLLSLIQCLLGAAALHIPRLITKLTRMNFPCVLCAFFYIFVICATVLGEMFSLYYKVSIWDSLLHFGSGIMTGMLGSILLVNLLERKRCSGLISPIFIAIAAVCFALCISVLWEIYEFAADSLLGLNMQKSLLQDGTELIGKAALLDTMKDLIVDTGGALVAAAASFVSLKRKAGWLDAYRIDKTKVIPQSDFNEKQVLPHSA